MPRSGRYRQVITHSRNGRQVLWRSREGSYPQNCSFSFLLTFSFPFFPLRQTELSHSLAGWELSSSNLSLPSSGIISTSQHAWLTLCSSLKTPLCPHLLLTHRTSGRLSGCAFPQGRSARHSRQTWPSLPSCASP